MELSFRWYGTKDPVKLTEIRQSNADFIVTSLHQIPSGEKWSCEEIKKRINIIKKSNVSGSKKLKLNVIESLPVHNNIKLRQGNYKKLIENYKDNITNIAKNKIKTICYNFMPVIDWTRTQLNYQLPTDGLALRFNYLHLIIFEKYILKIKALEKRYSDKLIKKAEQKYKKMSGSDLKNLKFAVMGGLPAAEVKYTVNKFNNMLKVYDNLKKNELRNNFSEFLKEIIPVAEEHNIKMALHPDDPPIPLFGLPRIVSTLDDYNYIFNQYDSKFNGMTFCVGSLASNYNNDVYKIFKTFSEKINFIHLRNVVKEKDKKSFIESGHLDGDVDFIKVIKMILNEENKRKKKYKHFHIPMRPDHGHCLLDDQKKELNPGYSVIGRMKGLAEIRGVIKTLDMNKL
jgi:mannonate dehydratase